MVTWILERDVFNVQHFDTMVQHAREREWGLKTVRVIPFIHEIEGSPREIRALREIQGPVVAIGSIGIAKLSERFGWRPGIFGSEELFRQDVYSDALGELILNQDPLVVPLSGVMAATVGRESFFIKPNDDNKAFAGMVIPRSDFENWIGNLREIGYLDDQDILVAISEPRELAMEWRNVVVDGRLIESSIYRQWQTVMPQRDRRPEVEELVMAAHARFQPAPIYVVDVAQTREGLRVVEYNTFNSAGMYDCHIPSIMDAVTAYVDDQTY